MLPLVVHIDRPQAPTVTRVFHESPVRIGRSPFASLRLREPFVSEWQAVVRFHGERTTYLDLGSRNPTHIQGRPIERNVETEIDGQTDIRIGTVRMRFERVAAPREALDAVPAEDTAFSPDQMLANDVATGTVALPKTPNPSQSPPPMPRAVSRGMTGPTSAPVRAPSGPIAAPARHASGAFAPAISGAPSLQAAEQELERARYNWLAAIKEELDATPAAQRAQLVRELATKHPRLLEEPSFRNWAQSAHVDPLSLGYVDVSNWFARLTGKAPQPEHTAALMERAGQLLELFASSFIESRRAHQRARLKLGLDKGGGGNVLTQSEDAHALLAHLLEPSRAAQARSHELRRLLGDFAMHQIALLSAVVEGARAMLTELSPRVVTELPDSTVDSSVLDQDRELANVWPFAAQKMWRKYMVRNHDLTLKDHFARELIGREFTRRYHAIADSASPLAADRGDKT